MMFRDDPFWGDNELTTSHNLLEVLDLIEDDITIKIVPFAKEVHNRVSIPQFELSDRPSDETIEKMKKLHGGYEINIYENTVSGGRWKYLMHIELLQYYNVHNMRNYTEGSYDIYDKHNPGFPLVKVPYRKSEFDNSISAQLAAKTLCNKITEKFNSGVSLEEW